MSLCRGRRIPVLADCVSVIEPTCREASPSSDPPVRILQRGPVGVGAGLAVQKRENKEDDRADKGNETEQDHPAAAPCVVESAYKDPQIRNQDGQRVQVGDDRRDDHQRIVDDDREGYGHHDERAIKHELLVVPCDDFGVKGYVRIAYCVSKQTIVGALPGFEKVAKEYGLI